METTKFVYWQDGDMWLGYLEEYPDYMTQGKTLDELKENLKDLFKDRPVVLSHVFVKSLN
jgi:predicted RNase H-like HicB family nuclease